MAVKANRPSGASITAQIHKLGAGQRIQVVCLSPDLTGANLHYTFRSFPCDKDPSKPHSQCVRCNAGSVPRWEGYFLGWSPSTSTTCIYRVSAGNAKTFESYIERQSTLRGAMVTMSRAEKSNGKAVVGIMPSNMAPATLPADINVWATLNLIWYGGKFQHQNASDPILANATAAAPSVPQEEPATVPFEPVPSGEASDSKPITNEQQFRELAQWKAAQKVKLQQAEIDRPYGPDPEAQMLREAQEHAKLRCDAAEDAEFGPLPNRINGHTKKGRVSA